METIWATPDLISLYESILAHRKNARPDPNPRGCNLHEMHAPHLGITIIFHDSISVGDDFDESPPLSVVVHDHQCKDAVFMGNVDPGDFSNCYACEWQRGDWEARLKPIN